MSDRGDRQTGKGESVEEVPVLNLRLSLTGEVRNYVESEAGRIREKHGRKKALPLRVVMRLLEDAVRHENAAVEKLTQARRVEERADWLASTGTDESSKETR